MLPSRTTLQSRPRLQWVPNWSTRTELELLGNNSGIDRARRGVVDIPCPALFNGSMLRAHILFIVALVFCAAACSSVPRLTWNWVAVDTKTRERVSLDEMADALQHADVVFLGEEHDNTVAHGLQLDLTRKLHELRGNLVVTLEMFETDVRFVLEDYLAGRISEEDFLAQSRPWPNYDSDYRPVVEWAKENGVRVVAGNVPRPVARRVAYEGVGAVRHVPGMPAELEAPHDEYLGLFKEAMGGRRNGPMTQRLYNWYTAQCGKDEVMAESILRWTGGADTDPIVVHWCGKFHSDRALGTAERVLRRRPDFKVAVVSTRSGSRNPKSLSEEDWGDGAYIWLVPSM